MLHLSSYFVFYACLNREQHFVNREDDIVYFKAKGEGIVFYNMNSLTRKHDAQAIFHVAYIKDARGYTHVWSFFYG